MLYNNLISTYCASQKNKRTKLWLEELHHRLLPCPLEIVYLLYHKAKQGSYKLSNYIYLIIFGHLNLTLSVIYFFAKSFGHNHWLHGNGFFLLCTPSIWSFKLDLVLNFFSHSEQLSSGSSGTCDSWFFKLSDLTNLA